MTNEEKLDFIKSNYKSARTWEILSKEKKDLFYEEWINNLIRIIPKNLYKYRACNDNNLSALKNKKAWFSSPSTWNDPIDVTVEYNIENDINFLDDSFDISIPKFAFMFINKYIESFCEQKKFVTADKVKEVYYSVFREGKEFNPNKMIRYLTPIVGEKPARQITVKIQEAFAHVLNPKFKEDVLNGFRQFFSFNDIRNNCIMYSLSETYSNNHQWAIYADNGNGFCIGYAILPKSKKEASLLPELLPIYYGKRKELSISRMLNESLVYAIKPETLNDIINEESELLFVSLHTKTPEWMGEQEWRFNIPLESCKSNLIDFDFATSIYLGENITDYWKNQLIDIAREQHLKVYQRKLNKTKSNWIYEEIVL